VARTANYMSKQRKSARKFLHERERKQSLTRNADAWFGFEKFSKQCTKFVMFGINWK